MSERKVLNKYYPPDFDPTLIPRARRPKNEQYKVRMMVPMSIRCLICGEFIYKGKKFNARKETVQNEEYLGIKIFRFYIKCTRCSSEITIKTDPKNSDYECEMGATRNFEGWKEGEKKMEEFRKQREEEEQGNAMKALENKTMDNKMEMDILDGLDEIRSLNARASKVDPMDILAHLQQQVQEEVILDEEEEQALKELKKIQFACECKVIEDEEEVEEIVPYIPKKLEEPKTEDKTNPPTPKLQQKSNNPFVLAVTDTGDANAPKVISLKFRPKFRSTTLVPKHK